jgi:3-oxoadipate enol-lactonase
VKEYTVTIRNYPYRIRETGKGTPFFWLHGMFYSLEVEDVFSVFDFEELSRYVRLIRVELPAHGISPLPASTDRLTWESIAADIREIADTLRCDRYFMGGFSQGACISAHVCINNPNVIGCVTAMLPKIWDERPIVRRTYTKLVRQLESDNGRIVLEKVFGITKYAPHRVGWNKNDAEKINEIMQYMTISAATIILKGAILSDMPEKNSLKNMGLPALVVGWDDDTNHPIQSFRDAQIILQPEDYFLIGNRLSIKSATFRLLAFILMYL